MATDGVQFNIDLTKFPGVLADRIAQGVAVYIRIEAKKKVRVAERDLQNSIQTEGRGGSYVTFSETPYAAAQEFGRPDLPNYGFTPYMRPSAAEAATDNVVREIARRAEIAAERITKI